MLFSDAAIYLGSVPGAPPDRFGFDSEDGMNHRVCRCCGEPMSERGNALSRNPNVCASCSSMADGAEQSNLPQVEAAAPSSSPPVAKATKGSRAGLKDKVKQPAAHAVPAGQ
jgi:hypothetical protein